MTKERAYLRNIQYSIDFVTAILLLSGQITTSGIFIVPEGFLLAATGPILGGVRLEGQTRSAGGTLDLVDVLAALLLIINAVRVTGPYVTSGRFFVVFSGPIFGIKDIVGTTELNPKTSTKSTEFANYIRHFMSKRRS